MKSKNNAFVPQCLDLKGIKQIQTELETAYKSSLLPVGRAAEVHRGLFETTQCVQFFLTSHDRVFYEKVFETEVPVFQNNNNLDEGKLIWVVFENAIVYAPKNPFVESDLKTLTDSFSNPKGFPSFKNNKEFLIRHSLFHGKTAETMLSFEECLSAGFTEDDAPIFGKAQQLLKMPKVPERRKAFEDFFEEIKTHRFGEHFADVLSEFL